MDNQDSADHNYCLLRSLQVCGIDASNVPYLGKHTLTCRMCAQIVFGDAEPLPAPKPAANNENPITGGLPSGKIGSNNNNYSRPAGQNVGNFITDRPSSRVIHAPGGNSQIIFG